MVSELQCKYTLQAFAMVVFNRTWMSRENNRCMIIIE